MDFTAGQPVLSPILPPGQSQRPASHALFDSSSDEEHEEEDCNAELLKAFPLASLPSEEGAPVQVRQLRFAALKVSSSRALPPFYVAANCHASKG